MKFSRRYTPRHALVRRLSPLGLSLALILSTLTFVFVSATQAPPAAAATLAPAEPTYPMPANNGLWTTSDGLISLDTTRVEDGASCYLYNGYTAAQWLPEDGGDGGNGDGRVCRSNRSPGSSNVLYRTYWNADASSGAVTRKFTFPAATNGTDYNLICSNDPAGNWTVSGKSGRSCTITFKAGQAYSGQWDMRMNLTGTGTQLPIGYSEPTIDVAGEVSTLPGINQLSVPSPRIYTSISYNVSNPPKGISGWDYTDGVVYATWTIRTTGTSQATEGTFDWDFSSLPAGSITTAQSSTQTLVKVPMSALQGQTGQFDIPLHNYQPPTSGTFTSFTPYAGVLPVPGYGEAVDFNTPDTNSNVPNQTWIRMIYDKSKYIPGAISSATTTTPPVTPQGETAIADFKVVLNQPTYDVTTFCSDYLSSRMALDTTEGAYMVMDGQTYPLTATEVVDGTRCSGATSSTYSKTILSGFPTLTGEAYIYIPLKAVEFDTSGTGTYPVTAYLDDWASTSADVRLGPMVRGGTAYSNFTPDRHYVGAKALLETRLALNTNPYTVGQYCYQYSSTANLALDTSENAYMVMDGVTYPLTATEVVGGTNCIGQTSASSLKTIITGLPELTSQAYVYVPFKHTGETATSINVPTYIDNWNVTTGTVAFQVIRKSYGGTWAPGSGDSPPTAVIAGNSMSTQGRIFFGVNYFHSDAPFEEVKVDGKVTVTLSSCALNPSMNIQSSYLEGNITLKLLKEAKVGPDGLACTDDDVSGWEWEFEGDDTLQRPTGTSSDASISARYSLSYEVPAWAQAGKVITQVVGASGSLTTDPDATSQPISSRTSNTTIQQTKTVGQAAKREATRTPVGEPVGWALLGFNRTDSSGAATFTWELEKGDVVGSNPTITAYGDANLSMVTVSDDGIIYTPWDGVSIPKFIRMTVTNFTPGWYGHIHFSMDTDGSPHNAQASMKSHEGWTNLVGLNIPATAWETTTLFWITPIIKLTMSAPDGITDANNNGIQDAGDTISYKLLLENTGYVDLKDITFSNTPLTGITCPAAQLLEATTIECEGTYTLTQADVDAGEVTNGATVDALSVYNDDPTTDTDEADPISITQMGFISLTKTANKPAASEYGEEITYTFHIVNTGNVPISNIKLNDSRVGWHEVTCGVTTLAPTADTTCSVTYNLTSWDLLFTVLQNTAETWGDTVVGRVTDYSIATVALDTGAPTHTPIVIGSGL